MFLRLPIRKGNIPDEERDISSEKRKAPRPAPLDRLRVDFAEKLFCDQVPGHVPVNGATVAKFFKLSAEAGIQKTLLDSTSSTE
jgi:hypothetical protein